MTKVHVSMLPSNAFGNDKHNAFDIMAPLPSKPRKKRSAERPPDKPIEEYEEFVALVLHEGKVMVKSSPGMRQYRSMVTEPDAKTRFMQVVNEFIVPAGRNKSRKPSVPSLGRQQEGQMLQHSRRMPKRRHQILEEDLPTQPYFLGDQSFAEQQQPPRGNRKMALSFHDEEAQKQWFADAFKAVQQVGCRTIAKVWIKKIHPKKQSTHPYNGSVPREMVSDPNRTKPPYWPNEVQHKEPDHIDRQARTKLLVHLIVNTPQQQIKTSSEPAVWVYAQDLLAALEEKKTDFKDDRWAIIQEIVAVRTRLEPLVDGTEYYDESATMLVTDFGDSARSKAGADEADDIKSEGEDEEAQNTPPSGHSTSAPSPEDALLQITQSSTRLGQDFKPPVDADQAEGITDSGPFSSDMGEGSGHLQGPNKSFAAQHMQTAEFMAMSSSQPHPALSVNTDVYGMKSGPGFEHRVGRPTMRQKMGRPRHPSQHPAHELAMMHGWAGNNSPTDFLPVEYTFNGTQCHTPIPTQTFRMAEQAMSGMTDSSMEMLSASMLDPVPYHAFMSGHPRPMPTRTMSSSQPNMMDHSLPGPPPDMYFHG